MKRRVIAGINRLISWLIALLLLMGVAAAPVYAADDTTTTNILPLVPTDLVYEDGNVILHKHGERIGPTEWKVTVRATIGEEPIEKRKMEVVFVLDCSGSMAWCTDETAHAAGDHKHNNECYYDCGQEAHTHRNNCYQNQPIKCTVEANPAHWINNRTHRDNTSNPRCSYQYNGSQGSGYYYSVQKLTCTRTEHTHSNACRSDGPSCGRDECDHSNTGAEPCTYVDANGRTRNYETRLEAAKKAVNTLVNNLAGDTVSFRYVIFSSEDYDNGVNKDDDDSAMVVGSYSDSLTPEGATYMYTGIQTGINQFSQSEHKKVLIVLTDGAANDNASAASGLNAFKATEGRNAQDGTVFTIGFNYSNSVLAGIAGNGGSYMQAKDADQLEIIFQQLEKELTAMLIDPMGTTVGFDKNSILGASTTSGVISWTTDTIYWNPSEDGESTVSNSTIEYSYTVSLNANADETVGEHYNVELNNPTDFLYGIKDPTNNTITNMKEAAFPIPRALYKLSSIETSWVDEEGDPIPITGYNQTIESDPIISDYKDANYIPAFDPKYTDITQRIYLPNGSGDYYQYTGSTVRAVHYVTYHDDNEEGMTTTKTEEVVENVTDLGAIDPSQPYHYIVVHNYKLVEAEKLPLGGTKTLIGRDFRTGDTFTFTLTAVTDGAPMPKNNVVPIKPTSGTIATFEFGEIDFTGAADNTYVYTIQETKGDLPGVVYDTTVRTLRVQVEDGKVVSYTIDNVENAPLQFTNRLTPGNLKVEKTEVDSYKAEHQKQEFNFIIQVKDMSNRPMTGTYTAEKSDGTEFTVTFDAGYAVTDGKNYVTLKAGESVVIKGLPMGATYTVTEDAPGGFTVTATGDEGTIVANETVAASFANAYHTTGQYQFRATKILKDASGATVKLAQGQFAFQVLDENGNMIPNGTGVVDGMNNEDGNIFFDTLTFTEADIGTDGKGTKTYQIVEVGGSDASVLYDRTVYKVTLTIADKGDGNLTITDDLGTDGKITFTNTKISNQLVVSKTVAGNLGSRNRNFNFTLDLGTAKANTTVNISTDGVNFTQTTLDEKGQTTFTLKHGQSISVYPVDGAYTVTETDAGSYKTTHSINQAEAVTGTSVTDTCDANGEHVAFVNTLEATVPTGIHTPVTSALIGICLAAGLIAIALAGRREVFYES